MANDKGKDAKPDKERDTIPRERGTIPRDTILVGGKPVMNYVTAIAMQASRENADKIVIKARGKFISRAVDAAEVVTKRFMQGKIEIESIKTDSEDFTHDGKALRTSTIDITLKKIKG